MDTALLQAFELLWQGMLGIFAVTGLIALLVIVLARLTSR